MTDEQQDLGEILAGLSVDVRAKTVYKIIENARRQEHSGTAFGAALNAKAQISDAVLRETLGWYVGDEHEAGIIETLVKYEGVRRGATRIIQQGAKRLEKIAKKSEDWRSLHLMHAGGLYAKAGLRRDAVRCYEDSEHWGAAADQWYELGEMEKASLCWEKNSNYKDASEAAEKYGNIIRALRLALLDNNKDLATKIAIRNGLSKRAVRYYEEAGDYVNAARYAKRFNLSDADRLYDQLIQDCLGKDDLESAETYAHEAERWDYVAQICERKNDPIAAARYWKDAGNTDRAEEILRSTLETGIEQCNFGEAGRAASALEQDQRADQLLYLAELTK
jgi:hypothetical protein